MAYNQVYNPTEYSALVLVALLFVSATNPLAHGQGVLLRSLTVGGSLCCTPTGNCPGGQPIPGVTVTIIGNVILDGGSAVVGGSGTTDTNEKFRISFPGPIASAFPQIRIPFATIINSFFPRTTVASVQLPLDSSAGCPMLNTTGILVSPVQIGPFIWVLLPL
ncbi:hypothetical protein ABFS83_10G150700 [Erythranthe nasuta]